MTALKAMKQALEALESLNPDEAADALEAQEKEIEALRDKEEVMDDKTRGLYSKFTVTRNDGSSRPGGKHCGCEYFVLDLSHDKHAEAALRAYAESCKDEYPMLAADLLHKLG